jgi:Protein of unknown function (DUF2510)
VQAGGWYPDPLGRHDLRYWSGGEWTDLVSDLGLQSHDPIEPINETPVTIRPSTTEFWKRFRLLPLWWWGLALVYVAIAFATLYLWAGWIAVVLIGGFGVACSLLQPWLYFKLFYIRADGNGIEIRNQLGHRQVIRRDRIAAITVGKAWGGSFRSSDFAFIVSPTGDRLGRFYLQSWDPKDFRRLANALGLQLYGRPGRPLDAFHSAGAVRHVALFYAKSLSAGVVIGCAVPVLFGVAVVVVLLHR